jgi:hypothetical protein
MPRVLEQFAKRGYVPTTWHSLVETGTGELTIDLQVEGLDMDLAQVIAASLRQIVSVETVLMAEKRVARTA